jgi:glycine oxidase
VATIGIAGAGLAGRLFAWALLRAGHSVEVFDPAAGPAPLFNGQGAAAFTAAGMLSPLAEQEAGGAEVAALGWQSLALWPQIVAKIGVHLAHQQGATVRLRTPGSLLLAHTQDLGSAQRVLARTSGAEPLTPQQLAALEPALLPGLRAWLLPGEGLIHPVEAMAALHDAAHRLASGAKPTAHLRWHWGQSVSEVAPHQLRVQGERRRYDWAIDARGLGAAAQRPSLRGVRGEIITLALPGHGLQRPLRLLHPRHRVYLLPRDDDQLVLGASEIESEDRSAMSVQSAVELMAAAHSVMPTLAEARITRLDVNLRPALPDNQPQAECEPGLLRLLGLYRHGWLLAPALVQQLLQRSALGSLA